MIWPRILLLCFYGSDIFVLQKRCQIDYDFGDEKLERMIAIVWAEALIPKGEMEPSRKPLSS